MDPSRDWGRPGRTVGKVMQAVEAAGTPAPVGGYVAGMAAEGRLLFISGQTPEGPYGQVATEPEQQLRQVWANLQAVLDGAGAQMQDLVQVRTYLSDRAHRDINSSVRQDVLGGHEPALTVVVCQLYEDDWVAEIEAVAVLADP